MKILLLRLVDDFLENKINACDFVESYQLRWKLERDDNRLKEYPDLLSECLAGIFCAAEMFEPDNDREPYEFDEPLLRNEISKIMDQYTQVGY